MLAHFTRTQTLQLIFHNRTLYWYPESLRRNMDHILHSNSNLSSKLSVGLLRQKTMLCKTIQRRVEKSVTWSQ